MDSAFDFCRIDWPGARGVKGHAVGLRVRALSGRARGRKISGARLSGVDGGLDGRIVPQRTGLCLHAVLGAMEMAMDLRGLGSRERNFATGESPGRGE